jgi:hypothetical protein
MLINNNFEEQIISFNDSDNSNDEDFNHTGQSITQHCKSYVFHLYHHDGKKLRFIHTSSFGDVRGLKFFIFKCCLFSI